MVGAYASAEITAPRALAATVPYTGPVELTSRRLRCFCRAVSLSREGMLVICSREVIKGEKVRLTLPSADGAKLPAAVARECKVDGRRALDLRFVNLSERDRIVVEGLLSQHAVAKRKPPPLPPRKKVLRQKSTTIAKSNEFDVLPSTDELDSLLAATLAELAPSEPRRRKKRKGRFRW